MMKYKLICIIMSILLGVDVWGQEEGTLNALTDEGVNMLFTVIDEELKTCMVGSESDTPVIAIEQAYDGAVTIPESVEGYTVTKIAKHAFQGCEITDVTIPASIYAIGDYAFACDGLNTVTFLGQYPLRITETTFYYRSDATLYVPVGCSESFMEAMYWKDFGQILEIMVEPEPYVTFSDDGKTMTFRYDTNKLNYDENLCFMIPEELEEPQWLDAAAPVTTVVFEPAFENARPTTTASWFDGMENLSLISGLENLNTSEVTSMSYMFQNCKSLRTIDLRFMNTVVVEQMDYMFNNCTSLKTIDLSNFNTSYNTTFYRTFNGCTALENLILGPNFDTRNVEYFSFMFAGCTSLTELDLMTVNLNERARSVDMLSGCSALKTLVISASMNRLDNTACQGVGTQDHPCAIIAPEGFDFGVDVSSASFEWKNGWFFVGNPTPYAVYNNEVLTFYYDNLRKTRNGTTYDINEWDETCITATRSVVFDKTFAVYQPTSTSHWFQGMKNLSTLVYIENLNTSQVKDMDYMFYDCAMLTDLDLSHFDTGQVGGITLTLSDEYTGEDGMTLYTTYTCVGYGMKSMFEGCTNLINLNVSSFNTQKVRNMSNMFSGCSSLVNIDVSSFNTAKVVDMMGMFKGCVSLERLDLSNFDISSVGNHPMGEQYEEEEVETIEHEIENEDTFIEYRSYSFIPGETSLLMDGCQSIEELKVSASMSSLAANACQGVGTEEQPSVLFAPEEFNFEGVDDIEGVFTWKSGVFCLGARKSTIGIAEVRITKGSLADIVVELKNGKNEYNAFQFDIVLPEGVDLVKENRNYIYWLTDRYSKSGCSVMINELDEHTYRFALYSLNNVTITGKEGPILILRLKTTEEVGDEVLEGLMDNIIFNGEGNISDYLDPVTFNVVTNTYPMGDVDHSGTVTIADVVSLVNYIIGITPSPFYLENADMNTDRVTNISDVMSIVGIVVQGSTNNAPPRPKTVEKKVTAPVWFRIL